MRNLFVEKVGEVPMLFPGRQTDKWMEKKKEKREKEDIYLH